MKKLRQVALTITALAFASASQAGFITVDASGPGSTSVGIASNNNFRTTLAGLGIVDYATGQSLGTDANGSVSYYYYAKEAGFRNDFLTTGLSYSTGYPSYQNYFGAPIEIGTVAVGAELLDFQFCAYSGGGSAVGCVSNAQNDGRGMFSFQSIAMHVSDTVAWLFWDDSGAGPDDNHDDMLVKAVFTPTEVPEPSTAALLGLTLLGLGFARRRRQAKQAI